jgi:1-aminocyclopropane-1-carboxylate deaminase/D-cysteine desulfhydrase-like pyridoxal-dependent ACC family enzyme
MAALDAATDALRVYPTILADLGTRRRVFAKPCPEHFALWSALCHQTGMLFDLVYAPRAWEIIVDSALKNNDSATDTFVVGSHDRAILKEWLPDSNIIYYHCGGTEGNESQLGRYSAIGLQ